MDDEENVLCVMLLDDVDNLTSEPPSIPRLPRLRSERGGESGGEFIHRIVYEEPEISKEQLRLTPHAFIQLVNLLIDRGSLMDGTKVKVPEQVGMCLFILARGASYRDVKDKFKRGIGAVKHYHREVLKALVELSSDVIRPYQKLNAVPEEIKDSRGYYWLYFKVKFLLRLNHLYK